MIYLRTGLPGASKTLNSLFELCRDHDPARPKFYHNVKLLMLDYDIATSFSGWFYGWYFPRLKNAKAKKRLIKIMKRIHNEDEFVTLQDVPWLETFYEDHDHFETWLYWVRRCYSPKKRSQFEETLQNATETPAFCFESVKHFNFHFTHFDDPKTWHQLPKTSIIFMDEVQQYFPPRGLKADKPKHIEMFETHRHHGFDIHLVTQDAKLMDVNVRRLVGRHIHFYNPMGGERVTRYEVPHAFDPDSWHDKQSAKKDLIKREKAMYGSYWSAEIHTHKFKLPRFVIYFALIALFLVGCGYMAYSVLYGTTEPSPTTTTTESQQAAPDQASTTAPSIQTYLTEQLANVYIDGVVVQTKERRTIYHYSFSDSESGAVFSPSHLGLVVEPINRCRARVFIDDIQHILTCNPFYKREPVEESYTQLSSEQATVESIGDI